MLSQELCAGAGDQLDVCAVDESESGAGMSFLISAAVVGCVAADGAVSGGCIIGR
jgi:hypothetical protein